MKYVLHKEFFVTQMHGGSIAVHKHTLPDVTWILQAFENWIQAGHLSFMQSIIEAGKNKAGLLI